MKWGRGALVGILFALPALFATYWTTAPAALAAYAAHRFPMPLLQDAEWDEKKRVVDLKRQIQKHFLEYAVYLPMEDIVAPSILGDERAELSFLMQNACGRARLYVWIPFKFRLPLLGDKVIDWCWKPRPKSA